MYNLKVFLCIFVILASSRFIPHPPNFTSLIALAFYIPAYFGYRYIYLVLLCLVATDLILGFHSIIFFTWGSVVLIGLFSKFLNKSILNRTLGCIGGAIIFFVITNFGVWLSGSYGYTLNGLINCYTLALPFFGNTLISTIIYSFLIELIYFIYLKYYSKRIN